MVFRFGSTLEHSYKVHKHRVECYFKYQVLFKHDRIYVITGCSSRSGCLIKGVVLVRKSGGKNALHHVIGISKGWLQTMWVTNSS